MKKTLLLKLVLCCGLLWLWVSACGGEQTTDPTPHEPEPTPTIPAPVEPPPAVTWVDQELLGAPGVIAACDHPVEAQLNCENATTQPTLRVTINASTYARWRLQAEQVAAPLTGDETLYLRVRQQGNLTPNFYLVTQNGERTPVGLTRYGLAEGEQELRIPLREIKNDAGENPDFATVNALEIVFEWADMQGELVVESLRFASVWQEPVAVAMSSQILASKLQAPAGFTVEAVIDNLREVTQLHFAPDGSLWVSQQSGRIWHYLDTDGDGIYNQRQLYTAGFAEVVGVLFDPSDGAVWIGGRGQLFHTLDTDHNGVADQRDLRINGLPWGRHQNNGLAWNPDPDPFSGEPGGHWLYFGLGSADDLAVGGEWNAAILRFPRTGTSQAGLQVVSHGNRNAYSVLWAPVPVDLTQPDGATAWQLFASENGPDFNNAPDEVNHIRWQHHYGFPEQFGSVAADDVDGQPYSGPVYAAAAHASASGLTYVNNPKWPAEYRTLYVSLFGQVFSPDLVGHTVERIALSVVTTATDKTYRGAPSTFLSGLDRPLPMAVGPDGDLYVGDYATGVIYRVQYKEK